MKMNKMLEDAGIDMDTIPSESHVIGGAFCDPIIIGESTEGMPKFWGKVNFLVMDDSGNVEMEDTLIFHVFTTSESDAIQKIKEYFESLNRDAEKEGREFEISNIGVKQI